MTNISDERLRDAVGFLKWLRPVGAEVQMVGANGAVTYDLTLSTIEAAIAELAELRKCNAELSAFLEHTVKNTQFVGRSMELDDMEAADWKAQALALIAGGEEQP